MYRFQLQGFYPSVEVTLSFRSHAISVGKPYLRGCVNCGANSMPCGGFTHKYYDVLIY